MQISLKRFMKISVITVLSLLFIVACGNNGSLREQATLNNNVLNPQDEMKAQMDQLNFHEIEIDISYGNDREYEAELNREQHHVEAKIEDDLNNIYISGAEAFDDLYPRVKELDLSSNSTDQEVITQILTLFELPDNYKEFKVDIEFNDNSKLEVEHRK